MSWQLSSEETVQATGARQRGPAVSFSGVETDSRVDLRGKLFIALKGERFDAHGFIAEAIQKGAAGVMVHEKRPEFVALESKVAFFYVGDTLHGLQDLGHYWRHKHKFNVLAITGSNGKTSSKEFAFQILREFKRTSASEGSFNNHWGVPISILRANPDTELLILEMGMNHRGELKRLAQIAEPNTVVVTMVGQSHIGELGSQENIALAKEELYKNSPHSVALFNLDNQWTTAMYVNAMTDGLHSRLLTFSSYKASCDVSIRAERMRLDGLELVGQIDGVPHKCRVGLFGRQNVNNLMVAASLAHSVGMPPREIWAQMEKLRADAWGRNQMLRLPSGTQVLFDAYNANPNSMTALLKNIYELDLSGKKVLVLGEMLELGVESEKAHRELGDLAGRIGVDAVWFIGPHHKDVEQGLKLSGYGNAAYFTEKFDPEVAGRIKASLGPNDLVAVKASRGQKLETVLEHWGLTP